MFEAVIWWNKLNHSPCFYVAFIPLILESLSSDHPLQYTGPGHLMPIQGWFLAFRHEILSLRSSGLSLYLALLHPDLVYILLPTYKYMLGQWLAFKILFAVPKPHPVAKNKGTFILQESGWHCQDRLWGAAPLDFPIPQKPLPTRLTVIRCSQGAGAQYQEDFSSIRSVWHTIGPSRKPTGITYHFGQTATNSWDKIHNAALTPAVQSAVKVFCQRKTHD